MSMPNDPSLMDWTDVVAIVPPSALLMGNGASMAVWRGFSYQSLYTLAETPQNPPMTHPLQPADIAIFKAMNNTTNFEQVLGALLTTTTVMTALGSPVPMVATRYDSIRNALVEAVHRTHAPWDRVPDPNLLAIRNSLLEYSLVFTTNYDLIVYWAMMAGNASGFKDYFWSDLFDASNTSTWGKATIVHYLHGGLHLARTIGGRTIKRKSGVGGTLLDSFGQPIAGYPNALPLFISEGTAPEKLASIYQSDYLAFAYSQLANYAGPLCLFGISLDDTDSHLRAAIQRTPTREIAISVRPDIPANVISTKAKYRKDFPLATLYFFDSTTHPLGAASLLIP